MKVVYLTAGAAGMFCGSCMHDNAVARALRRLGVDCLLQPVYTPIRTDEESVADEQVFLGGIHVYLLQQMPWLKFLPRPLRRWVDFPPLIRWATRRATSTNAATLGDLSISMLKGSAGNQAEEFERLVDWLDAERPDAVVLTNLLIGGALPEMRRRLTRSKLIVMLQGDDIFLDHLPEDSRSKAIDLCGDLISHVDHFCVHSRFYGDKMAGMIGIPNEKIQHQPLSIDLSPFSTPAPKQRNSVFRIGFFARIAPEKGLHRLVEAFERIAGEHSGVTLHAAGWLGPANEPYLDSLIKRLNDAGFGDRFTYHGSPDLQGKVDFLQSMDVLSVPTEYQDPKGLFVLESLAAGTPVVMPEHGAFGELVRSTGGGVLVPPDDCDALAQALIDLRDDHHRREALASEGMKGVHEKHSIDEAARQLVALIEG